MDKIRKLYYDLQVKVRENPIKPIIILYILFIVSIIL